MRSEKKMLENPNKILNIIKKPKAVLQKVNAFVHDLKKDRIVVVCPNLGAYEVPNED